ncbi:hypothetical protein MNBD_BACTEROID07-1975 [hydrothermal vent metagenome]|uniref:Uncharacterized protein n=1 Tax=hydrothermal vent metagenome TaxID=652676 RepID=A0A3B0V5Y2_9ZZZZ
MENKNKRNSLLTGVILAGALATFTIANVDARPATTRVLGSGAELRSEIIDLNVIASPENVFELKCGAGNETTGKKAEKKLENGKTVESKCGADKKAEAGKKAAKKTEKKSKTTEGKCGQGKCGAA